MTKCRKLRQPGNTYPLRLTGSAAAVIEAKGVPERIYTDEAAWAGGGEKRQN